jgi:archaellum biogenesis protein FlaJ (TadC family)
VKKEACMTVITMRGAVISKAEAENDKIIWRSSEKEKINTTENEGKKILGHIKTWH